MPISPWRMCDAAGYESARSELCTAIGGDPSAVEGERPGRDASALLDMLWAVDGMSRTDIDLLLNQVPSSAEGGEADDE